MDAGGLPMGKPLSHNGRSGQLMSWPYCLGKPMGHRT